MGKRRERRWQCSRLIIERAKISQTFFKQPDRLWHIMLVVGDPTTLAQGSGDARLIVQGVSDGQALINQLQRSRIVALVMSKLTWPPARRGHAQR